MNSLEATIAGVVRTPFVRPATSFKGIPEPEVARLLASEAIFASRIPPGLVDTVIVASQTGPERDTLGGLSLSLRMLGVDERLRVMTVGAGTYSDLVAVIAAVTGIQTGRSGATVVVGMGTGARTVEGDSPSFHTTLRLTS